MDRRLPLIAGSLLIAAGVAYVVYYYHACRFTPSELIAIDAKADLSGGQMRGEILTTHRAEYIVSFYLDDPAPRGDSNKAGAALFCRLASPKVRPAGSCATAGNLAADWSVSENGRILQAAADMPLYGGWYDHGGAGLRIERELGRFNAEAGHRYTIAARFSSADPEIKRRNPHLWGYISPAAIDDENRSDIYSVLIAAFLILGGIALATVKIRK
jgi:hypothetical protein